MSYTLDNLPPSNSGKIEVQISGFLIPNMYITSSWKINPRKTSDVTMEQKQPFEHVSPIKRGGILQCHCSFQDGSLPPQLPASDMKTQTSSLYIKSNRITFLKLTYITSLFPFWQETPGGFFFTVHCFRRFIGGSFWVLPTMQTNLQVAHFWPRNNAAHDRGGYPVAFPIWKAWFTL